MIMYVYQKEQIKISDSTLEVEDCEYENSVGGFILSIPLNEICRTVYRKSEFDIVVALKGDRGVLTIKGRDSNAKLEEVQEFLEESIIKKLAY